MSKNVWDFNFFLITNLLSALKLQDVKRIFKYFDKHHANLYAKPNHSTYFQFHKGHGFDISSLSLAEFDTLFILFSKNYIYMTSKWVCISTSVIQHNWMFTNASVLAMFWAQPLDFRFMFAFTMGLKYEWNA